MAIRRRGQAPVTPTGYPLPLFTKFALRFGNVVACFLTPGMQLLDGKVKRPMKYPPGQQPEAAICYHGKKAVTEDLAEAEEQGLTDLASMYRQILDRWPEDGSHLSSSAFHD